MHIGVSFASSCRWVWLLSAFPEYVCVIRWLSYSIVTPWTVDNNVWKVMTSCDHFMPNSILAGGTVQQGTTVAWLTPPVVGRESSEGENDEVIALYG